MSLTRPLLAVAVLVALAAPASARQRAGLDDDAKALAREHERVVRRARRLFDDFAAPRARKGRERALARWEAARDEALAVIFDRTRYPDEDHGRVGQPLVDEKVEVVRAVWPALEALVRKDLASIMDLEPAEAGALLEEVQAVSARCEALAAAGTSLELTPVEPAWRVLLAARAGAEVAAAAELPAWERHLLRRLRDEVLLRGDLARLRAAPAAGVAPTRDELEQARITNDYRVMMGRPALTVDTRLVESARGHADDMLRLDFFEHTSPVAGKETFGQRIAAAGYPAPGGENIAMGMSTPQAAHEGWYRSSGHHRNILDACSTAMGAGRAGKYWVQNFGR